MLSRAHLLIQHDLDELQNDPDITIVRAPGSTPSIFNLIALINGPPDTIWSEGVFQVNLKFDDLYSDRPPIECHFYTIPFHPNIHPETGSPSLDFLDYKTAKWSPKLGHSIRFVLKSMQQLLAYPLLDRAVNMEAVFMLKGNPTEYERITKQTVLATQDIRGFLQQYKKYNIREK